MSSGVMSKVPLWRRPSLVPLAFFLAFFSGALYGAGTSISAKHGMTGSSGSGAEHWIRYALSVQS